MSLNTAHAPGGVLLFTGELWPYTRRKHIGYIVLVVSLYVFLLVLRNRGELRTACREGADKQRILLYCDGVDVTFEGTAAKKFQGTTRGRIYLTTHRVVFVNKDGKEFLQSFSFPFLSISDLKLEQPFFGANYIQGKVSAEKNGNWTGTCTFNLKFVKGGAIEFGQAMMAAIKCAAQQEAGAPPAPYEPPSGPYVLLSPGDYMAAHSFNYGFPIPYSVFPDQPAVNTVYAANAPPPYPGVNVPPQQNQGATPSAPVTSSSSGSNSSDGGPSAPPAGFKKES